MLPPPPSHARLLLTPLRRNTSVAPSAPSTFGEDATAASSPPPPPPPSPSPSPPSASALASPSTPPLPPRLRQGQCVALVWKRGGLVVDPAWPLMVLPSNVVQQVEEWINWEEEEEVLMIQQENERKQNEFQHFNLLRFHGQGLEKQDLISKSEDTQSNKETMILKDDFKQSTLVNKEVNDFVRTQQTFEFRYHSQTPQFQFCSKAPNQNLTNPPHPIKSVSMRRTLTRTWKQLSTLPSSVLALLDEMQVSQENVNFVDELGSALLHSLQSEVQMNDEGWQPLLTPFSSFTSSTSPSASSSPPPPQNPSNTMSYHLRCNICSQTNPSSCPPLLTILVSPESISTLTTPTSNFDLHRMHEAHVLAHKLSAASLVRLHGLLRTPSQNQQNLEHANAWRRQVLELVRTRLASDPQAPLVFDMELVEDQSNGRWAVLAVTCPATSILTVVSTLVSLTTSQDFDLEQVGLLVASDSLSPIPTTIVQLPIVDLLSFDVFSAHSPFPRPIRSSSFDEFPNETSTSAFIRHSTSHSHFFNSHSPRHFITTPSTTLQLHHTNANPRLYALGSSYGYVDWDPTPYPTSQTNLQTPNAMQQTPPMHISHSTASFTSFEQAPTLDEQLTFDEEFQQLMANMTDERILKEADLFSKLSRLARDFRHASTSFGRVIIAESQLPEAKRTIKPTRLGGFAGGEKFICGGIVFRFAADMSSIYSTEFVHKEAAHQLRGLTELVSAGLFNNLAFPLMAQVDFRGLRLLAVTQLPINPPHSLVLGSMDGGDTVKMASKEAKERVDALARALNLKPHFIKRHEHLGPFCVPCDMEVHKIQTQKGDMRFYACDFARLFPPEPQPNSSASSFSSCDPLVHPLPQRATSIASTLSIASTSTVHPPTSSSKQIPQPPPPSDPCWHLIRLLRPELVRQNPVPLSSDAFSLFASQIDSEQNNREVLEATRRLHDECTVAAAKELNGLDVVDVAQAAIKAAKLTDSAFWASAALGGTVDWAVANPKKLTQVIHKHGVNCRHLGRVHPHASPKWQRIIVAEAVARVVKARVRRAMRDTMRRVRVAVLTPFTRVVAEELNLVLALPPCNRQKAHCSCGAQCACKCSCAMLVPDILQSGDPFLIRHASSESSVSSSLHQYPLGPNGGGGGALPASSPSYSPFPISPRPSSPQPSVRPGSPLFMSRPPSPLAPFASASSVSNPTIPPQATPSPPLHGQASNAPAALQRRADRIQWWCTTLPAELSWRFGFHDILARGLPTAPPGKCGCCSCRWGRYLSRPALFARVADMLGIILSPPASAGVLDAMASCNILLHAHLDGIGPRSYTNATSAQSRVQPVMGSQRSNQQSAFQRTSSSTSAPPMSPLTPQLSYMSAASSSNRIVGTSLSQSSPLPSSHSKVHLFNLEQPFDEDMIVDVVGTVRVLPWLDYAEGTALLIRTRAQLAAGATGEAARLAEATRRSFETGLAQSPTDPRLLCNLGFLFEVLDQQDDAERVYMDSLRANPRHFRSHYYYALLLFRRLSTNMPSSAKYLILANQIKSEFERALEISPDNVNALKDFARFLICVDESSLANRPRAKQLLLRCLELDPYHIGALEQLAVFLTKHEGDSDTIRSSPSMFNAPGSGSFFGAGGGGGGISPTLNVGGLDVNDFNGAVDTPASELTALECWSRCVTSSGNVDPWHLVNLALSRLRALSPEVELDELQVNFALKESLDAADLVDPPDPKLVREGSPITIAMAITNTQQRVKISKAFIQVSKLLRACFTECSDDVHRIMSAAAVACENPPFIRSLVPRSRRETRDADFLLTQRLLALKSHALMWATCGCAGGDLCAEELVAEMYKLKPPPQVSLDRARDEFWRSVGEAIRSGEAIVYSNAPSSFVSSQGVTGDGGGGGGGTEDISGGPMVGVAADAAAGGVVVADWSEVGLPINNAGQLMWNGHVTGSVADDGSEAGGPSSIIGELSERYSAFVDEESATRKSQHERARARKLEGRMKITPPKPRSREVVNATEGVELGPGGVGMEALHDFLGANSNITQSARKPNAKVGVGGASTSTTQGTTSTKRTGGGGFALSPRNTSAKATRGIGSGVSGGTSSSGMGTRRSSNG